jgi:hypothetical protein
MIPTVNFEGGIQDETTGRWPFTAKLVFNPIALSIKYRIQAIEIDSCDVWSATFGTIGEGCESKSVSGLNNPTNNPGDINGGGTQ